MRAASFAPAASVRPLARAGLGLVVVAVGLWLLALGAFSLTRYRHFSADSRNYVNVARNVLAGRGLVQDTAGFGESRFPTKARLPQPFGVHAPLYPLAIAALAALGLTAEDAALLLPVVCAGLTLLAASLLVGRLYDARAALLCAGLLVASFPLAFLATSAWSELLATSALFASLLALLWRAEPPGPRLILLAGLLAGLAFASRYPLVVALPLGALALVGRGGWRPYLGRLALYGAGFTAVAGPIVLRNLLVIGSLSGATRGPSDVAFAVNLKVARRVLLAQWAAGPEGGRFVEVLTLLLFGAAATGLTRRGEARSWLLERRRFVLWAWPLGYAAYMVLQRSVMHFDFLDARLLGPAQLFVPCLVALALRALVPAAAPLLAAGVVTIALIRGGLLADRIRSTPPAQAPRPGQTSERLRFVKKRTTPRDLLIVMRGTDLAFLLDRPSVYFTRRPEMSPVTREDLRALLADACPRYERVFLVFNKYRGHEASWRRGYGDLVTDLALGRLEPYPEVEEAIPLADGTVFRLRCLERR
jgi:4-amino-4-deoxy-L-arabinose transferase-like glycosyltransferase